MRRLIHLLILFLPGCGLGNVVSDADVAVTKWATQNGEVDACRLDAMQHCVGASAAAAICGRNCALLLGDLLEFRQDDGNAMDLANNEAGAGCALPVDGVDAGAVFCCEMLLNAESPGLVIDGPCN